MKKLTKKSETDLLLDVYGIYLISQLQVDEKTKEIGESFEKAQNLLAGRQAKSKKTFQGIYRAKAMKNRVRQSLLEEVRDFQRALLKIGQGDRKNALYQRYFAGGLNQLTDASTEDLEARMEKILANLKEEENEILKSFSLLLKKAFETFQKEAKNLEAAIREDEIAFSQEVVARAEWHKAYHKCEAELLVLFEANKNMATSFFLKNPKKKKKEGEKKEEAKNEKESKTLPMIS